MKYAEANQERKERGRPAPLFAVLAFVLALGAVAAFFTTRPPASPARALAPATAPALPHPVFSIENIDEIRQVEQAAKTLKPPEHRVGAPTRTIILPHHTLVAAQLAGFWSDVAATQAPSVIVLVGPAHGNQGKALVQTTSGAWHTPVGDVAADDALVAALVRSGQASLEPDSFVNEHAIGTHVSYVAKLFPGTPILPVIAQSPAGQDRARAFTDALDKILPDGALIVASVDFSHYLPYAQSDARDAATEAMIANRDYDAIDKASSAYFDSPFAVETVLMENDRIGCGEKLLWHDNIGRILNEPTLPATSYLVYACREARPFTLKAAGDVMVARNVGKILAAEPDMAAHFGAARSAFMGADVAFANLESVLSSRKTTCGNGICFEADPARVDALKAIGLTHVSVANNHMADYGEAAWEDSRGALKAAGIPAVGGYRNDGEPVFADVNGNRVAFLAYERVIRPLDPATVSAQVRAAAAKADFVAVSFHWGVEYQHLPNAEQKALAHAAVDAGADVVIGSHPHVLETIERYKKGLILYSLGNFVFDQIGDDQNESLVVALRAEGKRRTLELQPMRIVATNPRIATVEERASTLRRIASWSAAPLKAGIEAGRIEW